MKPRSLKTVLMVGLLILSLAWPSTSSAQENPLIECQSLLLECSALLDESKKVIEAKDKTIELKDLALTKTNQQVADLYWQVEESNKKLSSPFRNPFIMTTVGVVIGIIVTGYALRK